MTQQKQRPTRLVIVEDANLYRDVLCRMLESMPGAAGLLIVGEADNADDAVKVVRSTAPDVVLLDLQLPEHGRMLMNKSARFGIEAARRIRELGLGTRVVVFSKFYNDTHHLVIMYAALRAGVSGYLSKHDDELFVVHALPRVLRGERVFSPVVAPSVRNLESLSEREGEVFELVARRYTNEMIAERLVIAVSTVKTHVSNILEKLSLHSREDIPPRDDTLFFDEA
jgi:NarL family two-component system response regulator LiaR